jgi:hypothetical protein
MKNVLRLLIIVVLVAAFCPVSSVIAAVELQPSIFELERQKIRFAMASEENVIEENLSDSSDIIEVLTVQDSVPYTLKSPTKAFFLSLAVPGLGQYYYGSKIKPLIFLTAEVTSWAYYSKWHGKGNSTTEDYRRFNQEHWKRDRYEQYLFLVYGETDDDLIQSENIHEHLPDTRTQQYYEMTGKYDQFAWGWEDAYFLSGNDTFHLNDYDTINKPVEIVEGRSSTVPYSAYRIKYEKMRNDANNYYDKATRMMVVSIANHIISAFEAYFVTKKRNKKVQSSIIDMTRVKMKVDLKSYYTWRDTPFFTVSYKF